MSSRLPFNPVGSGLRIKALEAGFTGSVAVTTLLFTAMGSDAFDIAPNASDYEVNTDAASGTVFQVLKAGQYISYLSFGSVVNAVVTDLLVAITKDGPSPGSDPSPATTDSTTLSYIVIDRHDDFGITLVAPFSVTAAEEASGGVAIRGQSSDAANGTPTGLVAANVRFGMYRIGNAYA